MSPSLPPEIFDLIVDHLHDDTVSLEASCLVSKSWVPRTRRHLFAHVRFWRRCSTFRSWMMAFPDPSKSPAHHTRTLSVGHLWAYNLETNADAHGWTHSFHQVVNLQVSALFVGQIRLSLELLHGFSPVLKSLSLSFPTFPLSEVFNFICSFPLLEDLTLDFDGIDEDSDEPWAIPSSSPKFTGSLSLTNQIHPLVSRLLDLPGGLHFHKILIECRVSSHMESVSWLVSRCSDTLESLQIEHSFLLPPPLDLSKATKLKEMEFRWEMPDVRWIIMALQTVKSRSLLQITIIIHSLTAFPGTVGETIRQGWEDLDHLLLRLWSSHSILPKIVLERGYGGRNPREVVTRLLPELTSRDAVFVDE